jgi:hypothetical protein
MWDNDRVSGRMIGYAGSPLIARILPPNATPSPCSEMPLRIYVEHGHRYQSARPGLLTGVTGDITAVGQI